MTESCREQEIKKQMALLSLSRAEAENLVDYDNGADNAEADALTAKAKSIRRYEQSDKPRAKSTRVYKCDEDKLHLLEKLMGGLDHITTIDSVKNDSEFSFNFNAENYTVKLIQHRPHKT